MIVGIDADLVSEVPSNAVCHPEVDGQVYFFDDHANCRGIQFRVDVGRNSVFGHEDEEGFDAESLSDLVIMSREWFRNPVEYPDEGVAVAEEGSTKMIVDLVDATVVFQDREL